MPASFFPSEPCRQAPYLRLSPGLGFAEPPSAQHWKANGQHEAGAPDHAEPRADTRTPYRPSPWPHHDGVVVTLHSNVRWCSDHLELHARNREVVRVLFVLDACDVRSSPGRLSPMP